MANTYTQIHIHFVFAVKHRAGIIQYRWKDDLYKYITGIVQNNNHKMLIINGIEDHVHLLVGVRPAQSISDLMHDVKGASSKWINDNQLVPGRFEWQEGYGAFSYSKSQLPTEIGYIQNQEAHHHKKTFHEEYLELLEEFEVRYDERYLFKELM